MLPNFRVLICGAVFGLLFAITGVGVLRPDSFTRVGEMPEVGRPMMQRIIADEPAQTRFYIMAMARRNEELERLRVGAAREVVSAFTSAQPESDLFGPTVIENPVSDDTVATDATATDTTATDTTAPDTTATDTTAPDTTAPGLPLPGAASVSGPAPGSIAVHPVEIGTEMAPDADPVQVATLPRSSADLTKSAPGLLHVPLPPPRPAGMSSTHGRIFQRKHRVAQTPVPPKNTFGEMAVVPGN